MLPNFSFKVNVPIWLFINVGFCKASDSIAPKVKAIILQSMRWKAQAMYASNKIPVCKFSNRYFIRWAFCYLDYCCEVLIGCVTGTLTSGKS